jgi:NADPH:quinone reductase-like Zn-dependent oxidoreductase
MTTTWKRPLWRRILRWLARAISIVIALLIVALVIGYVRSDNECSNPKQPPAHPMSAIVYCDYGTADNLKLEPVEKPTPDDDQLLVKVRAAAVNPLDWHFIRGTPYVMRLSAGLRKPKDIRLGVDFSGTVEAVGKNVTDFKPGDEIFGGRTGPSPNTSGRAPIARSRESPPTSRSSRPPVFRSLASRRSRRSATEAKIQPGQKVLINGASGGVGTFAVQIAKAYGAEVTGVCSTATSRWCARSAPTT